ASTTDALVHHLTRFLGAKRGTAHHDQIGHNGYYFRKAQRTERYQQQLSAKPKTKRINLPKGLAPGCSSNAVITALKQDGWQSSAGRGKGSHFIFTHPRKPGSHVTVSQAQNIPIGTFWNIAGQAGWTRPRASQARPHPRPSLRPPPRAKHTR
ncbi:MAG: type II toxin-antitoxin system HicA family toxin, partial [Pseudomonadota bacterium]